QVALSGEAAAALGDLYRERWRRATDQELKTVEDNVSAIWPRGLTPDMEQVDVAISRTEPGYADYQEVREVEQLYLDAIAAARNYIYIENQYFTSPVINDALARRLDEKDGPEIVINLPLETEGWLAQNSLDIIRVKLLNALRRADRYGRLAVYYPYKIDLETIPINLHAKLMFVDDRFVRVGSSNLNNRSMGLDTECDIAIEARPDDTRTMNSINRFRNRLLSEHLGVQQDKVAAATDSHSALIDSIESLRETGTGRSLMPLEEVLPDYEDSILTEAQLVDPEQPINPEDLLYHYLPDQKSTFFSRRIMIWLAAIIVLLGLAALWRFTPLAEWLEVERIISTLETLREYPFSVPLMIAGFILAALAMVPVTVLIVAAIIVFGAWWGAVYSLIAAVSCAVLTYLLGSLVGRDAIKGLAGGRINQISKQLARHGVITTMIVRIAPVAPFTIINLVAGASHIRLRDFSLGTFLGLIPGITAFALLTDRIKAT
ncbi:MAG: VTT domain-containing protein, partial [Pseudohongiellaceae bacterium]